MLREPQHERNFRSHFKPLSVRPELVEGLRGEVLSDLLVAEYLLHPRDNIRRLMPYPVREPLEIFAARRIDVHPPLFGFGQKLRVLQSLLKSTPQLLGVFRGRARTGENRPADRFGGQNHVSDGATALRNLFFVENFAQGGHVRDSFVAFITGEEKNANKLLFIPSDERLQAKVGRSGHPAADDFAFFYGKINLLATRVA